MKIDIGLILQTIVTVATDFTQLKNLLTGNKVVIPASAKPSSVEVPTVPDVPASAPEVTPTSVTTTSNTENTVQNIEKTVEEVATDVAEVAPIIKTIETGVRLF